MSIDSVMPSNHLILCCPHLLLPTNLPSIRIFSSESALHIRWPKYWRFSFGNSPSNEYSGLISFRIDWFDLLAVRDSQESSSIMIWKNEPFGAQPSLWSNSHLYMTIGKTITLTICTFVGKVMSLLFNMLSRLVIAFLLRSTHLLTWWLSPCLQWFWDPLGRGERLESEFNYQWPVI